MSCVNKMVIHLWEEITIIDTHTFDDRAPEYIKEQLAELMRKLDSNIIIVEVSSAPPNI